MAIIICPNCGEKVSTTREKCPHCGCDYKKDRFCPGCGYTVAKDEKECHTCGYIFKNYEMYAGRNNIRDENENSKSLSIGDEEYKGLRKNAFNLAGKKLRPLLYSAGIYSVGIIVFLLIYNIFAFISAIKVNFVLLVVFTGLAPLLFGVFFALRYILVRLNLSKAIFYNGDIEQVLIDKRLRKILIIIFIAVSLLIGSYYILSFTGLRDVKIDGVEYEYDAGDDEYDCKAYGENIVVRNKVRGLQVGYLVAHSDNIRSVTFADEMTSIGYGYYDNNSFSCSFSDSKNLISITIPNSVNNSWGIY